MSSQVLNEILYSLYTVRVLLFLILLHITIIGRKWWKRLEINSNIISKEEISLSSSYFSS